MKIEDLIQLKGQTFSLDNVGVYAYLFPISNVLYVGSTKESFGQRAIRHFTALERGCHKNRWMQRLYNKEGLPLIEVLQVTDKDIDRFDLMEIEQGWMDRYREEGKTLCNMWPATPSRKGRTMPREAIERTRQANLGRKASPETRKLISDNHKAKGIKPPGNKGKGAPWAIGNQHAKGNKLSPETKAAIGRASKGNQYAKGYKQTEEARKKISEASKAMWERRRNENRGTDQA